MNTPPLHASRSHRVASRLQTSSETGRLNAGGDHEPVPEAVEALVRDPRDDAASGRRRAFGRQPPERRCARPHVHERALEHAVVVARPAYRRSLGRTCARRYLVPGEGRRADRVCDPVACGIPAVAVRRRRRAPAPLSAPRRYAMFPNACWKQLSSLHPRICVSSGAKLPATGWSGSAVTGTAPRPPPSMANPRPASANAKSARMPTIARRRVTRSPQNIPRIIGEHHPNGYPRAGPRNEPSPRPVDPEVR